MSQHGGRFARLVICAYFRCLPQQISSTIPTAEGKRFGPRHPKLGALRQGRTAGYCSILHCRLWPLGAFPTLVSTFLAGSAFLLEDSGHLTKTLWAITATFLFAVGFGNSEHVLFCHRLSITMLRRLFRICWQLHSLIQGMLTFSCNQPHWH